jgi:hypothetical protein
MHQFGFADIEQLALRHAGHHKIFGQEDEAQRFARRSR